MHTLNVSKTALFGGSLHTLNVYLNNIPIPMGLIYLVTGADGFNHSGDRLKECIERVTEAIELKLIKQSEIVEHCKSHQISRRQALACLKRYSKGDERLWVEEKGFARNVKIYALKKGES